jgi:hypothetical protein
MLNLIYFHYGNIPEYFYDNLHQVLSINNNNTTIYILTNEKNFENIFKKIKKLNTKQSCNIILSSIDDLDEILKDDINFIKLSNQFDSFNNSSFRNGFWKYTLFRFIYINELIFKLNLKNIFHIENDVLMYESFNTIYNLNYSDSTKHKLWVIQDSSNRVIPSLLFIPSFTILNEFIQFMYSTYNSSSYFINDMNLLGMFSSKLKHFLPNDENNSNYIYDGACLGQYVAGIDLRNSELYKEINYINPTIGFVNETSNFKPNTAKFQFKLENNLVKPKMILNNKTYNIVNLHIHSKDLYKYNSNFNLKYSDIITGDRITSLCDFVICSPQIYTFHKKLNVYANDVLLVNDWNNIQYEKLNKYLENLNKNQIKLFIYTHELNLFQTKLLPYLNINFKYIYYIHNSDNSFNSMHSLLLKNITTLKVYSQNIDYPLSPKLEFLPIGLANKMWPHGDLNILFEQMSNSYKYKKQEFNNIYINLNTSTYSPRQKILDSMLKNNFWKLQLKSNKSFPEYIKELSSYKFSLCIRGNGLDTHRFWESLYLGVIPVLIDNPKFKMENFIKYLHYAKIPCYVIKLDNLNEFVERYKPDFFNQVLYNSIWKNYNKDVLKISHYSKI